MQCLADIQIADPTITSGVMAGGGTASVSHHTWETITTGDQPGTYDSRSNQGLQVCNFRNLIWVVPVNKFTRKSEQIAACALSTGVI